MVWSSRAVIVIAAALCCLAVASCAVETRSQALETAELAAAVDRQCAIEVIVLGAGQDAGAPQIGYNNDPAWRDASLRQTATSIALVDHESSSVFLFDATPHIAEQLQLLDSKVGL